MPATTEPDGISLMLGEHGASIRALAVQFEKHEHHDDRRHRENISEIRGMRDELHKLNAALVPIASRVAVMDPIVTAYQQSRYKVVGALTIISAMLTGVVWVFSLAASHLWAWLASHIR